MYRNIYRIIKEEGNIVLSLHLRLWARIHLSMTTRSKLNEACNILRHTYTVVSLKKACTNKCSGLKNVISVSGIVKIKIYLIIVNNA